MTAVPVRQLLVLSSGRSGSTLLDRLLGRHEQVMSLGEILHWPKNRVLDTPCSCGVAVNRCPFWQAVLARLAVRLGPAVVDTPYALDMGLIGASRVRDAAYYSRRRVWTQRLAEWPLFAGQSLGQHWALPRLRRQYAHSLAVYDAVRAVAAVDTVVDSSKQYLRGIGLYRSDPQHTRLVLLVRDGRAVLHSRLQSGDSVERAVARWQHYYQRLLPRLAASVPAAHVFRLHYEDLVADPQAELARLFAFLQLPVPADVLQLPERPLHMTNGNGMRLRPLTAIVPDRRWEEALPAAARQYFERRAGALNRSLGYEYN